ncbi:MAG: hypothetical protein ABFD59_01490 [Smithella sp.]
MARAESSRISYFFLISAVFDWYPVQANYIVVTYKEANHEVFERVWQPAKQLIRHRLTKCGRSGLWRWKRITLKEYGRIARFMYLNFFILLINRIKEDGWVDGLWGIVQPTLIGYNEFVLAFLVVVLCGVSHLFLIRARRSSDRAKAISDSQSGDG